MPAKNYPMAHHAKLSVNQNVLILCQRTSSCTSHSCKLCIAPKLCHCGSHLQQLLWLANLIVHLSSCNYSQPDVSQILNSSLQAVPHNYLFQQNLLCKLFFSCSLSTAMDKLLFKQWIKGFPEEYQSDFSS